MNHTFQFSELKTRSADIELALNILTAGVIFVRSNGEVVLANTKAEELLRKRDGVLLAGGKLRALLTSESTYLQATIAGVMESKDGKELSAGGTILLPRRRGRPLRVTVAPLRNGTGLGHHAGAVLFISDPDQNVKLPDDLLCGFYGLTPAESRLTMILLKGCSLKEAADRCRVTHNTARSQLKSIFVKTNVQSQAQLIRLVLASVPLPATLQRVAMFLPLIGSA